MTSFCCPICRLPLDERGNSLLCEKNHCFDKAKSGYVNLLPSSKMHSKMPGDNKLMVDTRNAFLSKGYYSVLKDALCQRIVAIAGEKNRLVKLLDAGCGEGYYTTAMAEELRQKGLVANVCGVDISKLALNLAAKRTKLVQFGVGSVFDLPVADHSCDIVTELFAPYCGEEFYRVLKKDGILVLVIPAAEHLFELKQAVYEKPYKNEVKEYTLEGFTLLEKTEVFSEITMENPVDIQNLFQMTPYSFKTSKEDTARLMELDRLTTKIQFELLSYMVSDNE